MPGDCPAERVLFGTNNRYVAGRIVTKRESLALAARLDAITPRYIITEHRAGYRVPNPMEREP